MPSSRIGELALLPLFFKLAGKRAVVAGGSEPALWKTELLAAAGAGVEVFAEDFCDGFRATKSAGIWLHERTWRPADLQGAALAIGAMTRDDDAAAFATAARAASVPVNIIDRPAFCDFQFGAIANRSPLIIAITTDGAAPVLGQALRSDIEARLPRFIADWVGAAAQWRHRLEERSMAFAERRAFWSRFSGLALTEGDRTPQEGDFAALLAGSSQRSAAVAIVTLPATDVQCLTLAAIGALRTADVVIHDPGIAVPILDFARREALRVEAVGDAAARVIDVGREGKNVVRVRRQDAALSEPQALEVETLKKAGLSLRILPAVLPSA